MKKFCAIYTLVAMVVCILFNASTLQAQQGQTGVGLRLGYHPGITIKHFVRENGAIEGILHTGYRGLMVTGLYEWHKGVGESPGLKLYGGVGGHFGIFNGYRYYHKHYYYHDEIIYVYNRPSVGLDGIVGLEYDFQDLPLNLSLDLKPAVDFYAGMGYTYLDGAVSIRVLF